MAILPWWVLRIRLDGCSRACAFRHPRRNGSWANRQSGPEKWTKHEVKAYRRNHDGVRKDVVDLLHVSCSQLGKYV